LDLKQCKEKAGANVDKVNIHQIGDGFYRIPIPVPFPMKFVYCYLLQDEENWTIIDTGLNYPDARLAWGNVFSLLNFHPSKIKKIIVTHFHPDHFGLAGWLQEQTGAQVYMSDTDIQMAHRVWFPGSLQADRIGKLYLQHGMPIELVNEVVREMEKLGRSILPLPELTPLKLSEIWMGGRTWEVVHTPGHSDGQVCFYQPEMKWLLAADHILDRITPNISLWPECRPNPLLDYIHSLKRVAAMDVSQILPGHGEIITDVGERVQEILRHHEERLDYVFSLIRSGRTAYEVAVGLFGHKNLNPHQWRFAMSEILAHLEFLRLEGKLLKTNSVPVQYTSQLSA
jgi:glyoxylase-like metal-dependent hydrolase (beta-lactamase superfamily II)